MIKMTQDAVAYIEKGLYPYDYARRGRGIFYSTYLGESRSPWVPSRCLVARLCDHRLLVGMRRSQRNVDVVHGDVRSPFVFCGLGEVRDISCMAAPGDS
jgi:hypothetical protein